MSHRIAWIGPWDRDEWRLAWRELTQSPGQTCTQYQTVGSALDAGPAHIAVVAMSRPGEHLWDEIHKLQSTWPNAHVVCILGAWCCGLRRVAPELATIANYYAHELRPRFILQQLTSEPVEPETGVLGTTVSDSLLAIYARTDSYGEALSDSLAPFFRHRLELRFTDQVPVHGVDVVLWETSPHRDHWLTEVAVLKQRHPEAHRVALVNYPRCFERAELADQRGVVVLAQPFVLAELRCLLQDLAKTERAVPLKIIA